MGGAFMNVSAALKIPSLSDGGAGGAGVAQVSPDGALKVVIVGDERRKAVEDILYRLQLRDPSVQGIRMDGILHALVDEIAILRSEIEQLKQSIQPVQPKEEPHVTGSSFVLKI